MKNINVDEVLNNMIILIQNGKEIPKELKTSWTWIARYYIRGEIILTETQQEQARFIQQYTVLGFILDDTLNAILLFCDKYNTFPLAKFLQKLNFNGKVTMYEEEYKKINKAINNGEISLTKQQQLKLNKINNIAILGFDIDRLLDDLLVFGSLNGVFPSPSYSKKFSDSQEQADLFILRNNYSTLFKGVKNKTIILNDIQRKKLKRVEHYKKSGIEKGEIVSIRGLNIKTRKELAENEIRPKRSQKIDSYLASIWGYIKDYNEFILSKNRDRNCNLSEQEQRKRKNSSYFYYLYSCYRDGSLYFYPDQIESLMKLCEYKEYSERKLLVISAEKYARELIIYYHKNGCLPQKDLPMYKNSLGQSMEVLNELPKDLRDNLLRCTKTHGEKVTEECFTRFMGFLDKNQIVPRIYEYNSALGNKDKIFENNCSRWYKGMVLEDGTFTERAYHVLNEKQRNALTKRVSKIRTDLEIRMLQSIKNRIINYSDELNLEAYIKECNETGFVPYPLYVGDGKDLGNWFKNLNFSILDDNTLLNLLKTIIKTKTFEFYLNGVYHEKIFDKLRFPEIYELSSKMGLLNNKKKVLYRFNFSDNEGDN